jgi:hypothetical protein
MRIQYILYDFFFPVALQSFWTLAASHIGGFLSYLDMWWDSLDEWSARRKASTYTGQHNTERQGTNIHALSGIRTHDPSNQPAKTHASDRTATVTGILYE